MRKCGKTDTCTSFSTIVADICHRDFPVFFLMAPALAATTVQQLLPVH